MYRRGKHAFEHSTYIRRDRAEIMRLARRLAEQNGESFSRFLTDIVRDFLAGTLTYQKSKRRGPHV